MNIDIMSDFELARWYALYDAVNLLAEECEERGQEFNSIELKPLHLRKYIEHTCDNFAIKINDQRIEKEQFKKLLMINPSLQYKGTLV